MASYGPFLTALLLQLYASQTYALPTNTTSSPITVNNQSGDFCSPTNWYGVLIFFLGNYFAHAATVKSYPGERTLSVTIATIGALLIPSTGLIRGVNSIARNAKFKRRGLLRALWCDPDYETAAAAGACVMVVRRKSWMPCKGDMLSDALIRDEVREVEYSKREEMKRKWRKKWKSPQFFETVPLSLEENCRESEMMPRNVKIYRAPWSLERSRFWMYTDTSHEYVLPGKAIHGFHDFKDQEWSYALAHVPRDAIIQVKDHAGNVDSSCLGPVASSSTNSSGSSTYIKCSTFIKTRINQEASKSPVMGASYSIPKAAIAIMQVIYALVTLYQTSGNQIDTYGYSAFGLTVIPYALMSILNLVGSIVTPDYHALYLVSSEVMDEAIRRGARFDGVVGRLVPEIDTMYGTAGVVSVDSLTKCKSEDGCSGEEEKSTSTIFSYNDANGSKTFLARSEDYTSPSSLTTRERRTLISERIATISRDLSPSIFIPTCPRFLRHKQYPDVINIHRTQTTLQGCFSFTTIKQSTGPRTLVCFGNAITVLAIIGGMTSFRTGWAATGDQQQWIMHWYTFSALYSGFTVDDPTFERVGPEPDWGVHVSRDRSLLLVCSCFLYGIPAIGGFVVVAQMLLQYGDCAAAP